MLTEVLGILQWAGDQKAALDQIESAYSAVLARRLGAKLGNLKTANPELADQILALLSETDTATLRRVVLAPETCSRVMWDHAGRCDHRDLYQYLIDVLNVERGGLKRSPKRRSSTGPARWSALGDRCVNDKGIVVVLQPARAGLTVDSDSPAAVCFDYSAMGKGGMQLQHYHEPTTKELALSRLEAAMRTLDEVDPPVAEFVRHFTLVATVVTTDESSFSSGSTIQYVGRSMFCNAHLTAIDSAVLAEALVHEAIHSLLYMHELCEPWVRYEGLQDAIPIESPWTGSRLALRAFLHACFVWFGLVNFWTRAQRASIFPPRRIEEHLVMARRGFLKGPLTSRLLEHSPCIVPQVLELVGTMQEHVLSGAPSVYARH